MIRITVADKSHDWDWSTLRNVDAIAVERETGWSVAEWQRELARDSAIAFTALVWLVQRRDAPELRFEDVDYAIGEVKVEAVTKPGDDEDDGDPKESTDSSPES